MLVTAWNNGQHHSSGAGYGLKLNATDRDRHFRREWGTVLVSLSGEAETVEINVAKKSFWSESCRELISKGIGQWLQKNRLAPWPPGNPPKLQLKPEGSRRFRLQKA